MNGRILVSKPLYVALAQRKEDRKAHLAAQYMQRVAGMRVQQGQQVGQIFQPGGAGYFVPTVPPTQRYYPPQMNQIRPATPRWQAQQQIAPRGAAPQAAGYPNMATAATSGQMRGVRPAAQQPGMRQPNLNARPITGGQQPAVAGAPQQPPQRAVMNGASQMRPPMAAGAVQNRPAFKYTPTMRNPPTAAGGVAQQAVAQAVAPQAVVVQGQEPLTATMLAAAQPQEQKQMLGERLFPLIQHMYPDLAGKITGMLLEIDNSELLHMLESRESLKAKVEEAVAVLQAHQAKQAATGKE